jgi:hypothetical protein
LCQSLTELITYQVIENKKLIDQAQEIGKIMGVLSGKLAGKADGKVISTIAKEELSKLEMVSVGNGIASDEALVLSSFVRLFNYMYAKSMDHV